MKIKDNNTLRAFENAIDHCSSAVYLVNPAGQQYNLKNPLERYEGIGRLLEDEREQMELFTSKRNDESVMLRFFRQYDAA